MEAPMYGKYYESTFTGSMFGSGLYNHAVWGYVIANTKRDHLVELNPVLLAAAIGCDVEGIERAIEHLCESDPRSRSKKEDGRRLIRRGQFIYFVVNHEDYGLLRNEDERRNQNREAQRRHRSRNGVSCADMSSVSHGQPPSAHVDVSVARDKREAPSAAGAAALSRDDARRPNLPGTVSHSRNRFTYPEDFERWFLQYRRGTGKGTTKAGALAEWKKLPEPDRATLEERTAAWLDRRAQAGRAGIWVSAAQDPVRFLKGRRWEDELDLPEPTQGPAGGNGMRLAPSAADLEALRLARDAAAEVTP
jgi:hypothetical protein